jgi:hypothetical protein
MGFYRSTKLPVPPCEGCGKPLTVNSERYCSSLCQHGTDMDRFLENILIGDECWIWTGNVHGGGYGCLQSGGRQVGAHRFSYETFVGVLQSNMWVLHRCDTPLCVRPSHLFQGTYLDNIRDREAKNRGIFGERCPRAKLTVETVRRIRAEVDPITGNRPSLSILGQKYGVSGHQIYMILQRRSWNHVE